MHWEKKVHTSGAPVFLSPFPSSSCFLPISFFLRLRTWIKIQKNTATKTTKQKNNANLLTTTPDADGEQRVHGIVRESTERESLFFIFHRICKDVHRFFILLLRFRTWIKIPKYTATATSKKRRETLIWRWELLTSTTNFFFTELHIIYIKGSHIRESQIIKPPLNPCSPSSIRPDGQFVIHAVVFLSIHPVILLFVLLSVWLQWKNEAYGQWLRS